MKFLLSILSCLCFTSHAQTDVDINNNAVVMLNNGQYEKALPIFEGLVTEYPDNTMYRYNRAVTYFNLKKYKAALNDYLILINSDPTKAEYYFQAGNLYETL